ncbi:uncharacterized protein LOC122842819 [Gambusia affinis]|uniref:uncharacterized protein LOC122842819 n=1 Tax=Gambusia affinis TaxID=33528 RepID=UPI001CDB7ACC|nr:uncharacterized protein LOC122842819 [Gambusia affinis]
MAVTAGLSLLMLMALQAAAENTLVYFEIGKSLKLNPNYHEAINSISWKHKGRYIAQYTKDRYSLEYMGDYESRAHLDLTTGILTISNTKKSDSGMYEWEINSITLPIKYAPASNVKRVQFNAVGIKNLDDYPVEITVSPQGCSGLTSRRCTLVCGEKFEDAEPVQYFWKKGKTGKWKKGNKTIIIHMTKNSPSFPRYTCKVKNQFSEKESRPIGNTVETEPSSGPVPLPAILLVAVLAIGAAVIV